MILRTSAARASSFPRRLGTRVGMNVSSDRSSGTDAAERAHLAQRRRRALVRLIAGAEPAGLDGYFRRLARIDGVAPEAFGRAS